MCRRRGLRTGALSVSLTLCLSSLWICLLVSCSAVTGAAIDALDQCKQTSTELRCCLCNHGVTCNTTVSSCPGGYSLKQSSVVTCPGYVTTTTQTLTTATSASTSDPVSTSAPYSVYICVKNCADGEFYDDSDSRCKQCDAMCLMCSVLSTNCSKCKYVYRNNCTAQCPDGTSEASSVLSTEATKTLMDVTTYETFNTTTNETTVAGTTASEAMSTSPTTATEADNDEKDTIQCIDLTTAAEGPVTTATTSDDDSVKTIAIAVGSAVGGLLVIIGVIIGVICCIRRRGRDSSTGQTRNLDKQLQQKNDPKVFRKPIEEVEQGNQESSLSHQAPVYENTTRPTVGTLEVQRKHDDVSRYTKDPTASVDQRKEASARPDTAISGDYSNFAMVRLTQKMDVDKINDTDTLQTELDKVVKEEEELQALPQAPSPPKQNAARSQKWYKQATIPEGPTEDYVDMSGNNEMEVYENVQIDRGEKATQSAKNVPKGGKAVNQTMKNVQEEDGPVEDYENVSGVNDAGGDAAMDDLDYENAAGMSRTQEGHAGDDEQEVYQNITIKH